VNIAFISRFYWKDGAIPHIVRTSVKYFSKRGIDCVITALDVREELSESNMAFIRIPTLGIKAFDIYGIFFGFWLIPKMVRYHRKKGIDGIICHDTSSFYGVYLFSKIFRIPTIVFFHGWIYNPVRERAYRRSVSFTYKLNARFCAKYADRIGCVSEEIGEGMRWLGASDEKLLVMLNSVDLEKFNGKNRIRESMERRKVLFVGRLAKEKGVEYLIRATPDILAKIENVSISIIGSGTLENSLKRLSRKVGVGERVLFVGNLDSNELTEEYSQADIVVVPSLSEGHALVPLEALACGTPVVGSRIDGIVESVIHGYNGLLVAPRDHKAIASAIVKLLSDDQLLKKLSDNARSSVRKFSWDETISKLIKGLAISTTN
jgi:glycosyltransferase involved in cell wall biosynthesis